MHVAVQISQHHLLKRLFFLHFMLLPPLSNSYVVLNHIVQLKECEEDSYAGMPFFMACHACHGESEPRLGKEDVHAGRKWWPNLFHTGGLVKEVNIVMMMKTRFFLFIVVLQFSQFSPVTLSYPPTSAPTVNPHHLSMSMSRLYLFFN